LPFPLNNNTLSFTISYANEKLSSMKLVDQIYQRQTWINCSRR